MYCTYWMYSTACTGCTACTMLASSALNHFHRIYFKTFLCVPFSLHSRHVVTTAICLRNYLLFIALSDATSAVVLLTDNKDLKTKFIFCEAVHNCRHEVAHVNVRLSVGDWQMNR